MWQQRFGEPNGYFFQGTNRLHLFKSIIKLNIFTSEKKKRTLERKVETFCNVLFCLPFVNYRAKR